MTHAGRSEQAALVLSPLAGGFLMTLKMHRSRKCICGERNHTEGGKRENLGYLVSCHIGSSGKSLLVRKYLQLYMSVIPSLVPCISRFRYLDISVQ